LIASRKTTGARPSQVRSPPAFQASLVSRRTCRVLPAHVRDQCSV